MKQPITLPDFLKGISLYLYTPEMNKDKWTNATIDMVTPLYSKFSDVKSDREIYTAIVNGVFQDWVLKNHYKLIKKLQKTLEYEHVVSVGTISLDADILLSDVMQFCSDRDIPYNDVCFVVDDGFDNVLCLKQKLLMKPLDFEILNNITLLFRLWWQIENNSEYKKYLELKTIYDAQIKVSEQHRKK